MIATADRIARLLQRRLLVLDGAMGTELERRGAAGQAPLWSAEALIRSPQIVLDLHREYVRAGADILVANTFRTNPRTLRAAGRLPDGPALNRLAVSLARKAADGRDILVAASVAPAADCYRPDLVPPLRSLRAEHRRMARWLASAEPDLVWIETMNTAREARAAAEAARDAGLPLAVSFVVGEDGRLLGGDTLRSAVTELDPLDPLVIGLNCIPPRGLSALLPELRSTTRRPVAAYAHIGNQVPIRGWSFAEAATPPEYAEYAEDWRQKGASIIGGCCGTGPEHIAALRAKCTP